MAALACLCVMGFSALATAHPPYERIYREADLDSGHRVKLIKAYVDGVFDVDPVRLIVQSETGRMVGETPSGRDVGALCGESRCTIFLYSAWYSLFPSAVFQVSRGLVFFEVHSGGWFVVGALAPLAEHATGHLLALLYVAAACWVFGGWTDARWPRNAVGAGGLLVLFPFWAGTLVLAGRLSIPWLAILAVAGVVVWRRARRPRSG